MSSRIDTFSVCQPGLEPLVAAELSRLGVTARPTHGGVIASMTWPQLGLAHLHLRMATRLLVRVARFDATSFVEFNAGMKRVDWSRLLPSGAALDVRVATVASKLYHTGAIEERVREVVPSGGGPEQRLLVRLARDAVTVSLDASGDPLYMRGWRTEAVDAPLRETLAAAVVTWSGWDQRKPLVDPCAGSGTIGIEAVMLARRMPPGRNRDFAWQRWPAASDVGWERLVAAADADVRAKSPRVLVSDVDPGAVEIARANAQRAGIAMDVEVCSTADVRLPASSGWVVTNPPYGARVTAELRPLYSSIGSLAASPWRLAVVAAAGTPTSAFGRQWTDSLSTRNGGIPVRFLRD